MTPEEEIQVHSDKFEIVVDTIKHLVADDKVSWKQVVDIAYPGQVDNAQLVFKVDYEDANSHPTSGTLVKGNHVTVEKKGTTFSVLRSVVS